MVEWVRHCCRELDVSKVVLSGGVAQNIKACGLIGELDEVEDLYVCPSSGDGSLSIGGCYYVLDEEFQKKGISKDRIEPITNIYLGPEYSGKDIDDAIAERGLEGEFEVVRGIDTDWAVEQLVKDLVIARFSGRLEFGQRSLGNRSILANPANPRMIRKLNTQIKFRDFWMPFTPSVLAEYEQR